MRQANVAARGIAPIRDQKFTESPLSGRRPASRRGSLSGARYTRRTKPTSRKFATRRTGQAGCHVHRAFRRLPGAEHLPNRQRAPHKEETL